MFVVIISAPLNVIIWPGLAGSLDGLPALDVAERDPDLGRATADLEVVVIEDLPQLVVELDDEPLFQVSGRNHA